MSTTSIQWTDRVWNPCTGCAKVSPGCAHCYAETIAERFWKTQYPPDVHCDDGTDVLRHRRFTDVQCHPARLEDPLRWRKPSRVFVNSMSDLFHPDVPFEFVAAVFAVMAYCERHIFQILTKRADRMLAFMEWVNAPEGSESFTELYGEKAGQRITLARMHRVDPSTTLRFHESTSDGIDLDACLHNRDVWPLPNVWLGVSVENQHFADERIPLLLQTPAAIRFLSAEPLLDQIDIVRFLTAGDSDNPHGGSEHSRTDGDVPAARVAALQQQRPRWDKSTGHEQGDQEAERPAVGKRCLDWVICGGESGPKARPCDIEWIRSVVAQCRAARVACFVKQLGTRPAQRTVTGAPDAMRYYLFNRDRKGADPSAWPDDLCVREWPEVRA